MTVFGILVAAGASAIIGYHFWKATGPLRRGGGTPSCCDGCSGCKGKSATPGCGSPDCGSPGLYEIDPLPTSNEPGEQ